MSLFDDDSEDFLRPVAKADSTSFGADAPQSNLVKSRLDILEFHVERLQADVSRIRQLLDRNLIFDDTNTSTSTTNNSSASSNVVQAPHPIDQIFTIDNNRKKKCLKCTLQGEVRGDHFESKTHLDSVCSASGTPLFFCKGNCGWTKTRKCAVNAVSIVRPTEAKANLVSKVVEDSFGNCWCRVCGGAFVFEIRTDADASSKKRKKGDIAMAMRVSPSIARFTPGLYYLDDDLTVHSSLPLASKFVTAVISPAPQRVSGHPKHFDEARHTFGVTHLPVTETGLVDCFAILSRARYEQLGRTPAGVLHALKQGELALYGGRDDGFVTLRTRAPAHISPWGPAVQFLIDCERFVVMSVHELRDDAERCLPSVADEPMPAGDQVSDMFAALPQQWPQLHFDADEDDAEAEQVAQAQQDEEVSWQPPLPQSQSSPPSPASPPSHLRVTDVVKLQLLVRITSWEHVDNPNGIFAQCVDDADVSLRDAFWCHPSRRRLLVQAMRVRLPGAAPRPATPRQPVDDARMVARVLALMCLNGDSDGIDSVLALASDLLRDIVWLDWERAIGHALSVGRVGLALRLLAALRFVQPPERVVATVWWCAATAIQCDEFALVEPWLDEIQWRCPYPAEDFRRASLLLAACRFGRVAALQKLLARVDADEQWKTLTQCDGPVPPPILEAFQQGRSDVLSALCDMPALDLPTLIKSGKYPWMSSSINAVKWLFEHDLMAPELVPRAMSAAIAASDSVMLRRLLLICDIDVIREDSTGGFILQYLTKTDDAEVYRALVANPAMIALLDENRSTSRSSLRIASLLYNDVGLFKRLPMLEHTSKPMRWMIAEMVARGSFDSIDFVVRQLWADDPKYVLHGDLVKSALNHPHERLFETIATHDFGGVAGVHSILRHVLQSGTGSAATRAALLDAVLLRQRALMQAEQFLQDVEILVMHRQFVVADVVVRHFPDVVRLYFVPKHRNSLPASGNKFTICCCPSAIPLVQQLRESDNTFDGFRGHCLAGLVGEHLTPAILDQVLDTVTFFEPLWESDLLIALIRRSPEFDAQIDRLLARNDASRIMHQGLVSEAAKLGNQRLVDRLRSHPHCPPVPLLHEE